MSSKNLSTSRAEATRVRLLEAAWKLLTSSDDRRTRMADVAKEAGVSRQAVYLHFPSRAELLIATMRHIDEVEDVAAQLGEVFSVETGRGRLEAFLKAWCSYIPVVYGGAKWLLAIKDEDPDAEAAWQDRMDGLYDACSMVVESLHADNDLTADLTIAEAADLLWSMVSVRQWELLTLDRGISQKRYIEIIHQSLLRALLSH